MTSCLILLSERNRGVSNQSVLWIPAFFFMINLYIQHTIALTNIPKLIFITLFTCFMCQACTWLDVILITEWHYLVLQLSCFLRISNSKLWHWYKQNPCFLYGVALLVSLIANNETLVSQDSCFLILYRSYKMARLWYHRALIFSSSLKANNIFHSKWWQDPCFLISHSKWCDTGITWFLFSPHLLWQMIWLWHHRLRVHVFLMQYLSHQINDVAPVACQGPCFLSIFHSK